MNAVLKSELMESERMSPQNEDGSLALQIVELRSDVQHIQSDVTNIYAEVRATNQRIDWLVVRTDERLEKFELKIDKKFDKFEQNVNERFDKAEKSVNERFDKVDKRFDGIDTKLDKLIESGHSMKIWGLRLYIGLTGSILLIMARALKWL